MLVLYLLSCDYFGAVGPVLQLIVGAVASMMVPRCGGFHRCGACATTVSGAGALVLSFYPLFWRVVMNAVATKTAVVKVAKEAPKFDSGAEEAKLREKYPTQHIVKGSLHNCELDSESPHYMKRTVEIVCQDDKSIRRIATSDLHQVFLSEAGVRARRLETRKAKRAAEAATRPAKPAKVVKEKPAKAVKPAKSVSKKTAK